MSSVSPGLSCTCPNHQPKVKVRAARYQGGDCRRGPPNQESLNAFLWHKQGQGSLIMSLMIPRQSLEHTLLNSYESSQWQRLPRNSAPVTQTFATGVTLCLPWASPTAVFPSCRGMWDLEGPRTDQVYTFIYIFTDTG